MRSGDYGDYDYDSDSDSNDDDVYYDSARCRAFWWNEQFLEDAGSTKFIDSYEGEGNRKRFECECGAV